MTAILAGVLRWLVHLMATLALILGVLLAIGWMRSEWTRLSEQREDLRRTQELLGGLERDLEDLDRQIERARRNWENQQAGKIDALKTKLVEIEGRLTAVQEVQFPKLEDGARKAREAANRARTRREQLEVQSRWWDIALNRDRFEELQIARVNEASLENIALIWERGLEKASNFRNSQAENLRKIRAEKESEIQKVLAQVSGRIQQLLAQRDRKQNEIEHASALAEAQRRRLDRDPKQRGIEAVTAVLPVALWILLGIVLTPIAIKAFLYFGVAPLAAKLKPVRLLPGGVAVVAPSASQSAVSLPLDISPGEEIVVHADFLQSSSQSARKQTQWLLDSRIPLSSIASGMFLLTRIRPEGADATRVFVSSQTDAFGEVAALRLPGDCAVVVQPRSLAGVVRKADKPTRITRHWRLNHLHAWLTLQLRYLVFHGPCTLVLKGCRGVRTEVPGSGAARVINQAATLGFSANLDYRNTRCETFVAYLRGKEALFNDTFAGGPGCFVYEEMPASRTRTGLTGRGIEGLIDAVLKAFGI